MSDAEWLGVVILGFFVLRIIFATMFFLWILPDDDRCPCCDAVTVRVQSKGWNILMPWFRTSWCYECGWHGLLRHNKRLRPHSGAQPGSEQDRKDVGRERR